MAAEPDLPIQARYSLISENFPQQIALPRGCLEPVQSLLQEQGINWELVDERQNGSPLEVAFTGQLRADQEAPRIVQATGRLHRQQSGKTSVRIIDWLDLGHPVPQRMWERRLRGYRAMGYELTSTRQTISGGGHVRPPSVQ